MSEPATGSIHAACWHQPRSTLQKLMPRIMLEFMLCIFFCFHVVTPMGTKFCECYTSVFKASLVSFTFNKFQCENGRVSSPQQFGNRCGPFWFFRPARHIFERDQFLIVHTLRSVPYKQLPFRPQNHINHASKVGDVERTVLSKHVAAIFHNSTLIIFFPAAKARARNTQFALH